MHAIALLTTGKGKGTDTILTVQSISFCSKVADDVQATNNLRNKINDDIEYRLTADRKSQSIIHSIGLVPTGSSLLDTNMNGRNWIWLVLLSSTPETNYGELLETILCADKCQSGCKSYTTNIGACYNGQGLFPSDPSWSSFDVWDEVMDDNDELHRLIFASKDGTCHGTPTDDFRIPLNVCVGPFGQPRPWGTLRQLQ